VKTELIFPALLILMQVGASVIYMIKGDIRMAVYFGAAAVLNFTVVI
jgi:hypothetical protein